MVTGAVCQQGTEDAGVPYALTGCDRGQGTECVGPLLGKPQACESDVLRAPQALDPLACPVASRVGRCHWLCVGVLSCEPQIAGSVLAAA